MKSKITMVGGWAFVLVFVAGCGSPDFCRVSGVATRNGQPMKFLQITFVPDDAELVRPPIAMTDKDGKFRLTTGSIVGVKKGAYSIHIDDPERVGGGKTSTEADYVHVINRYSAQNSDLKLDVSRHIDNYELKLDD
jgi:hypothetical protein